MQKTPTNTRARASAETVTRGATSGFRNSALHAWHVSPGWITLEFRYGPHRAPMPKLWAGSQGKGLTDDDAQASAVMEAIEVACAERDHRPSITASPHDMKKRKTAHTLLLGLLRKDRAPPGTYENLDWLLGVNLVDGAPIHVPLDAATLNDADPPPCYWQSTDGLASGNTMAEAIFHGMAERIERDATVLWSLRDDAYLYRHCLDPEGLDNGQVSELIARVESADLQIRLFDLTSDIGVPVCQAVISPPVNGRENRWMQVDLAAGCGCHVDMTIAAIRAITEAAQTRLTTIAAVRDDFDPATYYTRLNADLLPYVRAKPAMLVQPSRPTGMPETDFLLERLKMAGITQVIAVPLLQNDPDFAVVKIFVPELENPPGNRQHRFGPRAHALSKATR